MLTSVSRERAFGGTQALALRLRLVWLERYADAITDRVGQPLFNVGGYSGQNVASLSRELDRWFSSDRDEKPQKVRS
jgi:hypothetical protein